MEEAIKRIRGVKSAFPLTLEVNLIVNMQDASKKKGKQREPLRHTLLLPHPFGEKKKVLVFAEGKDAEAALAAGAVDVGGEDLVKKIADGKVGAFDVCLATPSMSKIVKVAARFLRQNTPTANKGTVVEDIAKYVKLYASGTTFKSDKSGAINTVFGSARLSDEENMANLRALLAAVQAQAYDTNDKFIRKMYIAGTQGRGYLVEIPSL